MAYYEIWIFIFTVPDPPIHLSTKQVYANSVVLTWATSKPIMSVMIKYYRWIVTFKNLSHELPKYCPSKIEDSVTYFIKNDQTYYYEIINLRPDSWYFIELSAATESGFGNSTNITIHTLPSGKICTEFYFIGYLKINRGKQLSWNKLISSRWK